METLKFVYCSCEVGKREVLSRAYLAGALARRGIVSMIGGKQFFDPYIADLPPGVFFYKSVTKVCERRYRAAREHGHLTAGVCEETLPYISESPNYPISDQIYEPTVKGLDIFFTSNPFEEEHFSGLAKSTFALGNLRLHFARDGARYAFEHQISAYREKFGEYILVNSPGLFVFSQRTVTEEMRYYEELGDEGMVLAEVLRNLLANDIGLLDELLPIVKGGRSLIVRPHPHENPRGYRSVFGLSGDKLATDHEFHPWAAAAQETIGFNCTTELESIIAGYPYSNRSSRAHPWTIFPSLKDWGEETKFDHVVKHFRLASHGIQDIADVFDEHTPDVRLSTTDLARMIEHVNGHQTRYQAKAEKRHPEVFDRWMVVGDGRQEITRRAAEKGYMDDRVSHGEADSPPVVIFHSRLGFMVLPGPLARTLGYSNHLEPRSSFRGVLSRLGVSAWPVERGIRG
jgi:surface carbohydrate biosynthesis protein